MFVLYSLSMPRTVAPNKLSNKSSLTGCSDGTTFSRLDSVLNTLVYYGKEHKSLLKEGVVSPSEKLTLVHEETYTGMAIMELFVVEDTGVNLDAHRLGTGYR